MGEHRYIFREKKYQNKRGIKMPIESGKGGTTFTGHGDMPNGGISMFTLLHAKTAMEIHTKTGGQIRVSRNAGPVNVRNVLNQHYPNRPNGPFKGKTAKKLLEEINDEIERQKTLTENNKS